MKRKIILVSLTQNKKYDATELTATTMQIKGNCGYDFENENML